MPIGAAVAVPCGKNTEKRRGRVFPWLNEALHTRLPHAPRKRPQRPNFRRVLAVVIGWYSARRARESPENQGPSPTASACAAEALEDFGSQAASGGLANFLGNFGK